MKEIRTVLPEEPVFHSFITDCLDPAHYLSNTPVFCNRCKEMLHASNNETMQNWFETQFGNYCTKCLVITCTDFLVRDDE